MSRLNDEFSGNVNSRGGRGGTRGTGARGTGGARGGGRGEGRKPRGGSSGPSGPGDVSRNSGSRPQLASQPRLTPIQPKQSGMPNLYQFPSKCFHTQ